MPAPSSSASPRTPRIIGLGEILWDVFPDGPRFGGAPANAACSVAELAGDSAEVLMISGVGTDALGDDALSALKSHGVSTRCVQRHAAATGRVDVALTPAGVATYCFAEESAWDQVTWDPAFDELCGSCQAVCFGTLGQRGRISRQTIQRFLQTVAQHNQDCLRVLDINLRPPYDDDQVLLESLHLANVLKLNDEELPRVCRVCDLDHDPHTALPALAERYGLRAVALTRSTAGAVLLVASAISDRPAPQVAVADTVGAGDAYTAAIILGLLAGHSVDTINQTAIAVAGHACTVAGGTMTFPAELHLALSPTR